MGPTASCRFGLVGAFVQVREPTTADRRPEGPTQHLCVALLQSSSYPMGSPTWGVAARRSRLLCPRLSCCGLSDRSCPRVVNVDAVVFLENPGFLLGMRSGVCPQSTRLRLPTYRMNVNSAVGGAIAGG